MVSLNLKLEFALSNRYLQFSNSLITTNIFLS